MLMNKLPIPENLSIVIPYFNEELNVEASIQGALCYLRKHWEDFEIVAVDDHSTDRTLEILCRLQADEPRIRIVALPQNTRFAGALKRGFAAASKAYVFYTDGDCPIDYEQIDDALKMLDRYDIVVGYRTTRDKERPIRRLYTSGYRMVLAMLLGLHIRDVNFSFKRFPKAALDASICNPEAVAVYQKAGYRAMKIEPMRSTRDTILDLTQRAPLVTTKASDESKQQWDKDNTTGLRYEARVKNVEFYRDVKPIRSFPGARVTAARKLPRGAGAT